MEWTLLADYLTPVEFLRLTHTHRMDVPAHCWKTLCPTAPCPRTACRVLYLVDRHGAEALADSILTESAAMRAVPVLWKCGETAACIRLARFARVHRWLFRKYKQKAQL